MYFLMTKLVIHVSKMQQIMFFLHQLMMNVNLPIGNVYCGSALTVLVLISHELKDINWTERLWFRLASIWLNLLVHIMASQDAKKTTIYLDAKVSYKNTFFFLWTINPSQDSLFHTHNNIWESKTVFYSTQDCWFSQRLLYSTNWKIILPPQVQQKYLENIMLLTLDINYLNPHQATSALDHNMPKHLALNPKVNNRMNSLTTIVTYSLKVYV